MADQLSTDQIPVLPLTGQAPVLQLDDIRKSFNNGRINQVEVLHGINLTLAAGEFCALTGPSGAGKSTLLNIIGLLDRPSAGQLTLCGQNTANLSEQALTRLRGHQIGFVLQAPHLLPAFSALENVMLPQLAIGGANRQTMTHRALWLLEQVGLLPFRHAPVQHLSGGQQQRVALARALSMQPALLLADEPTGNLDSANASQVFQLLRQICRDRGMAVLFVTHNEQLARRCDRIETLQDGRLVVAIS